ncbi:C4-dicarboxylate ABC transporter permease [Prosthecomicrobium hirschii]|uniref:TRAP transporter large permease n=1 Tax=Prosthecodimorpha hirschii TaxID=665126 RepID=UPI00112665A9|nr:TRAP transporter large permease subunit [Prosthecomicrobium hirschii]TPQ51627.1 C4-dicarboxylate ABC transporter permease [Prosthecomicrobium hirschii]
MEWYVALAVMIGLILTLMGFGVPVAFAFFATNIVSIFLFMGGGLGIRQMVANFGEAVSIYALTPLPLFLIMGSLFFRSGLGDNVFHAVDLCIGQVRARLSYIVVLSGAVFAALSGSSIANTGMMGSAMVPEMLKRGYKPHMSFGPILGAGGLAVIIPPSSLAVLLGSLAQIDVGALLIAGFLPGILLTVMYMALITAQVTIDPEAAPNYDTPVATTAEKFRAIVANVIPMAVIVLMVIGSIITGIASPTESAALGCLGVLGLLLGYRRFSWGVIWKSLDDAMKVSGMTFLIIAASTTFAQALAFSGASNGMIQWFLSFDLPPMSMLFVMIGIILILGMFMDQLSMMLITLPVFIPIANQFGFDLVWFGLLLLLSYEVGFTTPPFGLLLFIMLGVAPPGTTLKTVSLAALPYILCTMLLIVLIAFFPAIALFLPRLL